MRQMCAGQPRSRYRRASGSFRLQGHSPSVRLEAKFREAVEEIAAAQGMTTARFLALFHDEVEEIHGAVESFASLIRCACPASSVRSPAWRVRRGATPGASTPFPPWLHGVSAPDGDRTASIGPTPTRRSCT